jgi:N-acetylmuramoyl-L-alanine amidase
MNALLVALLLAAAPAQGQRGVVPAGTAATWPPPPPPSVLIVTPRGTARVPISLERGGAALAAALLAPPLGLSVALDGSIATVTLGGGAGGPAGSAGSAGSSRNAASAAFVFQLGTPFVQAGGVVYGLGGEAYLARDTLFLPLTWLADCLPRALAPRYRWDPGAARLDELPVAGRVAAAPPPSPPPAPGRAVPPPATATPPPVATAPHPLTGLRFRHTIVIDPGHGGADPGNPGRYFPGGLVEKDITLAISRLLRAELTRRGIAASLTRSTDTLIDLADRGAMCRAECDLFVSVHVNAMPAGARAERTSGVETYFLSDAKTEDQQRVAKMENDAVRFEGAPTGRTKGPIDFILKDLQLNEYLRESARLAQLVQARLVEIHPGGDHGVQQAGFTVLAIARRPAILVETGFATNRTDGAFLTSSLGQHKIASAIADGLVAYLQEFEHKLAVAAPAGGR